MIDKSIALRYAGRLAIAARSVIDSDALQISDRIKHMELCLNEYDNYVLTGGEHEREGYIL